MTEKKSELHSDVSEQSSNDPVSASEKSSVTEEKTAQASMQWYVVQVRAGYERKVLDALNERIKQQGLIQKFGQIIVPTEEVVEIHQGRKRKTSRKFYPGYVLVEMDMDEDSWYLVQKTPGVIKFIGGTSDKPVSLSNKEVDKILQCMQEGVGKPRPKILFEVGEVVRIVDGPFAEFNGEVEDVNYEKNRLRVSVIIFGRATPVELEFGQVKKA
ncbi:MAG: transcription termination/antitermination protein NusG [Gammaproteobacteria bacterium]|nr:MAG: transcription termination/antitermination protein NusG [Gammaproteobacteria bacterium]